MECNAQYEGKAGFEPNFTASLFAVEAIEMSTELARSCLNAAETEEEEGEKGNGKNREINKSRTKTQIT